ncbi:PmoA family protein [Microbacterium jejuense]|uniref:DUF6807 domain-containing protein n=1 Tax=Microbacterium jejuense TaxID=1263637 RepID=UPI0031E8B8BA
MAADGLHLRRPAPDEVLVDDGGVTLFRYALAPDLPQREAPRPFLHPIRTRSGHVVSLNRPHDHVWHKGIAWSLPVVGTENFWGGSTYIRGRGYVRCDNNGAQRHRSLESATVEDDVVRIVHTLDWITQAGGLLFTEERTLTARLLDERAWLLTFETAMANVTDAVIPLGSPTTRGRENAGYGGLFWRGPRSFTGGAIVTPEGVGRGSELRGQRHPWMAFVGSHDEIDAESAVVIADHPDNPRHPPQWFVRSEEFACLNPAPFFSEEYPLLPDETLRLRYGVVIADAGAAAAGEYAGLAADVMAAPRAEVRVGS